MAEQNTPTEVGPLFAGNEIVQKEPEKIWDNNDSDPANETKWMAFFSHHEAEISASEEGFIAEYKRRRDIANG